MSALPTEQELTGDFLGSGTVRDQVVDLAIRIVGRSGVAAMHAERLAEHAKKVGGGGRSLIVPVEAAIAVMLLNQIEQPKNAPHVTKAADTILHRLTQEQCVRLNLPTRTPFEKHKHWVDRIHASLDQVFRHIDPHWVPNRRAAYTKVEWKSIVASRDPEEIARKTALLYDFLNALVQASVKELPWRYRGKFKGHRAVDGVSFKISARGTKKLRDVVSIEPNAWWYRRKGDHKVENLNTDKPYFFGYEATLFSWCKEYTDDRDEYPNLVDAVGFNPPGWAPDQVVTGAARTIFENPDLPIGPLRGDLQYWAGQNIDKFHRPMWGMGFSAVTDYRAGDLGIQGEPVDGGVWIDGDLYCPSILRNTKIVTASADYKAARVDYPQLRAFADARRPYLVTDKQKPLPGQKRVVQCPAAKGTNSTLYCPLKNTDQPLPPGAIPLPLTTKSAGSLCDNRNSLTIQATDRRKFEQHYRYGTHEWFQANGQREVVENFNKDLKYSTALGGLGNLRLHGFAAHYFMVAICVIAVNVHRINNFIAVDLSKRPRRKKVRRAVDAPYSGWHRTKAGDEQDAAEVIPITNMAVPLEYLDGDTADPPPAK